MNPGFISAKQFLTTGMLAVFFATGAGSPAQQPSSAQATSEPGIFRIAGRAVNAVDGHPLPHAIVTIAPLTTRRTAATMATAEDGSFAFDHLSPGKYTLHGEVRGYIGANYQQHEQFSTAIVAAPGINAESLQLTLRPAAALSGRIVDEAGDPVRSAQVTLYRERHNTGKREVVQVHAAQTDDRGEYAVANLPDGAYFLAVKAIPWYATHPLSRNAAQNDGSPILTGVDPSLDVAYPITFYPGVTDSAAASPFELKGGGELHIDMHLAPVHAARIFIHTTPGEQGFAYPQLQTPVFDGFDYTMGQVQGSPEGMEMVGLPPGRYQVRRTDPKTGLASHPSTIDLSGGSAELEAFTGADAPAKLKVSLQMEGGGALPQKPSVSLRTADATNRFNNGFSNQIGQVMDDKGEITFSNLQPADYRVSVYGGGHLFQVLRIDVADKHSTGDQLHVESGQEAAITLSVASSSAGVEGLATLNGKPAPAAMIVLAPVDAIDDAERFRRDQSDLDGTFVLPNVPAGRYIAVAIDDGWKLEWGKAAVLTPYLVHGVPVEIPVTERRSVRLSEALAVQLRKR